MEQKPFCVIYGVSTYHHATKAMEDKYDHMAIGHDRQFDQNYIGRSKAIKLLSAAFSFSFIKDRILES